MATVDCLRLKISEAEGLYNLCSDNKGADQLHSYHTAYQRLFFSHVKSRFSLDAATHISMKLADHNGEMLGPKIKNCLFGIADRLT